MIYLRKSGGMWFWRVGCLGGSFYLSRKPAKSSRPVNAPDLSGGFIGV